MVGEYEGVREGAWAHFSFTKDFCCSSWSKLDFFSLSLEV